MTKDQNIPIDFLSDIHISAKEDVSFIKDYLPENPSKILVIAGDISEHNLVVIDFLIECKKYYRYIFYTNGNHEMYLLNNNYKNSFEKLIQLDESISKIENCFYLNGFDSQRIYLEEFDLSFSGLCMWWDAVFANINEKHEILSLYKYCLNDYKYISGNLEKNIPVNSTKLFKHSMKMLKKIPPVDVMVTHYCPVQLTQEELHPSYKNSPLNRFFYFNGDDEIKRINPKVWFFGHTHKPYTLKKYGTDLVCNPFGYIGENMNVNIQTYVIQKIRRPYATSKSKDTFKTNTT